MRVLMFVLIFANLQILKTAPTHIIPLVQKNSLEKCFIPVILQLEARNVHLICISTVSCPLDIVNNLPGVAWTFFTKLQNMVLASEWLDICMVSAEDAWTFIYSLEIFQKCQRTKVILYSTASINGTELKSLFRRSWKFGVTDIVVVTEHVDYCDVFTYFPFSKTSCYDVSPVLLNSWSRTNEVFNSSVPYFPQTKLSNLYSCELRIEYEVPRKINGRNEIELRWYGLISFVLSALNARAKLMFRVSPNFPHVLQKHTDMFFTPFYQTVERMDRYIYSPISTITYACICLPSRTIPSVEWFRIFNEFSLPLWCGITIALVVTVAYVYFIFQGKKDAVRIILLCLQSLMNVATPVKITRWQNRIGISGFLLFSLVLNSCYQSTLRSRLAAPFLEDAIEDAKDFLDSDIPIHIPYTLYNFTTRTMWVDPEYKMLRDKVRMITNISYWDMIMNYTGEAAYVCSIEDLDYVFVNNSYRILPGVDFENLISLLMLGKPSPFERAFNKAILQSFDAGAYDYINYNVYIPNSTVERKRVADLRIQLSMKALSAVFMIWVLGCSLAFFSFVIEVFV